MIKFYFDSFEPKKNLLIDLIAVLNCHMFYKVSNIATVNAIESAYGAAFRFPHLHSREALIDGLNEEILPIITRENQDEVNFGIWGLLPHGYRDNWADFQKVRNTLNIDITDITNEDWLIQPLKERRCIVLITGFFASFSFEGQIYPVYIHSNPLKPLCVAAIYNISEDGFYNFSFVLVESNDYIKNIHNISRTMPLIMDENSYDMWLDDNDYELIFNKPELGIRDLKFESHTVAKEFYKNNIVFESILEPAIYKRLVTNS